MRTAVKILTYFCNLLHIAFNLRVIETYVTLLNSWRRLDIKTAVGSWIGTVCGVYFRTIFKSSYSFLWEKLTVETNGLKSEEQYQKSNVEKRKTTSLKIVYQPNINDFDYVDPKYIIIAASWTLHGQYTFDYLDWCKHKSASKNISYSRGERKERDIISAMTRSIFLMWTTTAALNNWPFIKYWCTTRGRNSTSRPLSACVL